MISRNELKLITHEINSFVDAPTPPYLKKISEQIDLVLPRFEKEERSLRGKAEVLGNLSKLLQAVAGRISALLPWHVRIANYFHFWETEEQILLRSMISRLGLSLKRSARSYFGECKFSLNNGYVSRILKDDQCSAMHRIRECAFRVLRGSNKNLANLDSKINGAPFSNVLHRYVKSIEDFLTRFKADMTEQQIDILENALGLMQVAAKIAFEQTLQMDLLGIGINSFPKEREADLSYETEEHIDALEVGSRLLLPGGYRSEKSGHAVLYEILRIDENNYRFTVCNTGAGAELEQGFFGLLGILFTGKVGKVSYLVPKEAILDQDFWIDLLSFETIASSDHSMQKVFELFRDHFTNKHGAEPEIGEKHELQGWRNCTFECIATYMESLLPEDLSCCLQQYMIHEANQELSTLLPQAKKEKLFNSFTLALLEKESSKALKRTADKIRQFWQSNQPFWIANRLYAEGVSDCSQFSNLLEKKILRIKEIDEQVGSGWISWALADSALWQEREALSRELALYEEELQKSHPGTPLGNGMSELFSQFQCWMKRYALSAKFLPAS